MKTGSFTAMTMGLLASVALAGNYKLTIDGKPIEVDLGEITDVTLQGGQKVQVKLEKKEVADFKSDVFSFSHPSSVTPSKTNLGKGIEQTMMSSPAGTLVLIQEYANMDPVDLIDIMITSLTKEEVQAGYSLTKKDVSKKLSDGSTVTGKQVVTKNRTTEYERYVLCRRVKDGGVMIITQVEQGSSREDLAMIDLFWKTMKISGK